VAAQDELRVLRAENLRLKNELDDLQQTKDNYYKDMERDQIQIAEREAEASKQGEARGEHRARRKATKEKACKMLLLLSTLVSKRKKQGALSMFKINAAYQVF